MSGDRGARLSHQRVDPLILAIALQAGVGELGARLLDGMVARIDLFGLDQQPVGGGEVVARDRPARLGDQRVDAAIVASGRLK